MILLDSLPSHKIQHIFHLTVIRHDYHSPPPSTDKKNASHSLCTITQSGLGLPDRDYYFDADKQEKRDKYKEYISSMFKLLGEGCGGAGGGSGSATLSVFAHRYQSKEQCDKAAEAVVGLEMMLAEAHLTRTGDG